MEPRFVPTFSEESSKDNYDASRITNTNTQSPSSQGFSTGATPNSVQYIEYVHGLNDNSPRDAPIRSNAAPQRGTRGMPHRANSTASKVSTTSSRTTASGISHKMKQFVIQPVTPEYRGPEDLRSGTYSYVQSSLPELQQVPTFTELTQPLRRIRTFASSRSLASSPHSQSNSISTSINEDRHCETAIPPSFSLHKDTSGTQEEMQPIYSQDDAGELREKGLKHKMYHLSLFCCGALLLILIMMVSVYAGMVSEVRSLDVPETGAAFIFELKPWPGSLVARFTRGTFEERTNVFFAARKMQNETSYIFNYTTLLHQAETPHDIELYIESDARPLKPVNLILESPVSPKAEYEAEMFGLFNVSNGFSNPDPRLSYLEFEVFDRAFTGTNYMDVMIPASLFQRVFNGQGGERWIATLVVAATPGVKTNNTEVEEGKLSCVLLKCPLDKELTCSQELQYRFHTISTLEAQENPAELNFGKTFTAPSGSILYASESTETIARWFQDPQTNLYGVVLSLPELTYKILYLGMRELEDDLVAAGSNVDIPVELNQELGSLPESGSENGVPFVIEVYPPLDYLVKRNFPKQRMEPCIPGSEVVEDKFKITVEDAGILQDEMFTVFWDEVQAKEKAELSEGSKLVFTFSELTNVRHTIRLRASHIAEDYPVKDDKATYRIKLENLVFDDQLQDESNDERSGFFDINKDVTFTVELVVGAEPNPLAP